MNLAFLMPVWKRPQLTADVLHYYVDRFRHGLILDSPGSGIDPASLPQAWDRAMVPNSPLGAKMNWGLRALRAYADIDGVMILGSDDLVSDGYLHRCRERLRMGTDIIRLQACYYLSSGAVWHSPHALPGAGMCLSLEALHGVDWKLWRDRQEYGLDASMFRSLTRWVATQNRVQSYKVRKGDSSAVVLDIKTGGNMWELQPPYLRNTRTGVRINQTKIKQGEALPFLHRYFPGQSWIENYLTS